MPLIITLKIGSLILLVSLLNVLNSDSGLFNPVSPTTSISSSGKYGSFEFCFSTFPMLFLAGDVFQPWEKSNL